MTKPIKITWRRADDRLLGRIFTDDGQRLHVQGSDANDLVRAINASLQAAGSTAPEVRLPFQHRSKLADLNVLKGAFPC